MTMSQLVKDIVSSENLRQQVFIRLERRDSHGVVVAVRYVPVERFMYLTTPIPCITVNEDDLNNAKVETPK